MRGGKKEINKIMDCIIAGYQLKALPEALKNNHMSAQGFNYLYLLFTKGVGAATLLLDRSTVNLHYRQSWFYGSCSGLKLQASFFPM